MKDGNTEARSNGSLLEGVIDIIIAGKKSLSNQKR